MKGLHVIAPLTVVLAGCSSPAESASEAAPAARQDPAANSLRYTPTDEVRRAAVADYARRQPGSTPATVQKFVVTFGPAGPADYNPLYAKMLTGSGLRDNDVADAFAAYTVATYRVAHGEAPAGEFLPAGPSAAVRSQYASLAARLLAGQPAGTKAQLGEQLKLQAVLVYVGAQRPSPAFRQNVARKFRDLYKLDVNALTLTSQGLVGRGGAGTPAAHTAPPTTPATTTSGTVVAAGAQWFFRSVSDAYGGITFEPVALLADGQYCEVNEAPLESLTAADRARHPAAWGRWRKSGNAFELIDNKGRTASYKLGTGSWFPTYPAGATPLHRTYKNSSGGSVGVATSLVISKITFLNGGRFTEGANGGIVAPNAAGGSQRSASGTYRLQGHTLTLMYASGRTVQKSFAIGAAGNPPRPSNTLVFIGGDAYTDE